MDGFIVVRGTIITVIVAINWIWIWLKGSRVTHLSDKKLIWHRKKYKFRFYLRSNASLFYAIWSGHKFRVTLITLPLVKLKGIVENSLSQKTDNAILIFKFTDRRRPIQAAPWINHGSPVSLFDPVQIFCPFSTCSSRFFSRKISSVAGSLAKRPHSFGILPLFLLELANSVIRTRI